MTTYWTEDIDGVPTDSVDTINDLQISTSVSAIYAQGDSINFEEFFAKIHFRHAQHIVKNSKELKIVLKSTPSRTGFDNPIVFENCKILELNLSDLKFKTIAFKKCIIEKLIIQQYCVFNSIKIHSGTTLEEFHVGTSCYIENLEIEDVPELNKTILSNSRVDNISIKKSNLGDFHHENNQLLASFNLDNVEFGNIYLKQVEFNYHLEISNCPKGNLVIDLCELKVEDISLVNCSIIVKFHKVRTYSKQIYRLKDSQKSKVFFERCYFFSEVLFQGSFYNNEKNLFISYTVFKDLVLFDDDHCKCLMVKECLFQNGVLLPIPNTIEIREISSSAWCLLKNQAISRNENIKAFEYRKNELTSYTNELKGKKNKTQERIVLLLNRLSNNHGIDWGRGILFTLSTWLLFYMLFEWANSSFCIFKNPDCTVALFNNKFWSDALTYLWIPDGLTELAVGLKTEHSLISFAAMIIFFILGKVSIAYGIFQTISAFRRHGKA